MNIKEKEYNWNIKVYEKHFWFQARLQIIKKLISNLNLPKNKILNILDIGSGSGVNLSMLSEFGKVSCIEPDDENIEYTKQKFPEIQILKGDLPYNNPYNNQKFDLITILDVIEHIEKDYETLLEIKNMLNNDGKIIITVPAFQFLFGPSDIMANHCRRYSKKALKNLIIKAGFKNFKIYYFNTFLFLPIVFVRLFEKFFRKNTQRVEMGDFSGEKTSSNFGNILNTLLFKIMSIEKYLYKLNPIGISLVAVIE